MTALYFGYENAAHEKTFGWRELAGFTCFQGQLGASVVERIPASCTAQWFGDHVPKPALRLR
jgi:hypothetical protein